MAPKLFKKVKPRVKQEHDCFVFVLDKCVEEQLGRLEVDFNAALEFCVNRILIIGTPVDVVYNIQVVCPRAEWVHFLFIILFLQSVVDLKYLCWRKLIFNQVCDLHIIRIQIWIVHLLLGQYQWILWIDLVLHLHGEVLLIKINHNN